MIAGKGKDAILGKDLSEDDCEDILLQEEILRRNERPPKSSETKSKVLCPLLLLVAMIDVVLHAVDVVTLNVTIVS